MGRSHGSNLENKGLIHCSSVLISAVRKEATQEGSLNGRKTTYIIGWRIIETKQANTCRAQL